LISLPLHDANIPANSVLIFDILLIEVRLAHGDTLTSMALTFPDAGHLAEGTTRSVLIKKMNRVCLQAQLKFSFRSARSTHGDLYLKRKPTDTLKWAFGYVIAAILFALLGVMFLWFGVWRLRNKDRFKQENDWDK